MGFTEVIAVSDSSKFGTLFRNTEILTLNVLMAIESIALK